MCNNNAQLDVTDCINLLEINEHNHYTTPILNDIKVLFLVVVKISFVIKNIKTLVKSYNGI